MSTYTRDKKEFFTIFDGRLAKKVENEAIQGAKRREKGNGEIVYEVYRDGISGFLIELYLEEYFLEARGITVYSWKAVFYDGDMLSILTIPYINFDPSNEMYYNRYSHQFLSRLPNINFEYPVSIEVGKGLDKKKEKPYYWLKMFQGRKPVHPFFTKDNLPALIPKEKGGFDNADQMVFLKDHAEQKIVPKMEAVQKRMFPDYTRQQEIKTAGSHVRNNPDNNPS